MKILLIPLGIAAFVLFLLVLGAVGLLVSMAVISALGRLWNLVSTAPRRLRKRSRRTRA